MPAPTPADRQFGDIAIKNRLLSKSQVEECLKALEKSFGGARTLGEVVEKKGFLSTRAVTSIARAQNYREVRLDSKLYARIAVKNRFAEVAEVRQCLEAQKKAYLRGEPPPDFGELLRARGHVTAEEDRAIREAIRKLDKEELVGRKDALGPDSGDELPAASLPAAVRNGSPAAPARKDGGSTRVGGKGAPSLAKKSGKVKKPARAEDDDELLTAEDDDAETAEAGAISGEVPMPGGDEGTFVDGLLEEAKQAQAGGDPASDAVSSASDGSSSRVDVPPAPAEVLEAALQASGDDRKPRDEDTNDLMDVVIEAADLAPIGGKAAAEGGPGAPGAAKAEPRSEPAPTGVAAAESIARVRDVTPPGGVPRLTVDLAQDRECPRCNVTIEAGTPECLYCGYVFFKEDAAKPAGERKAATAASVKGASGSARARAAAAGGLEAAFEGIEPLAACARGELFRGRERKTGKARLVWKLPAGLEPTPEQAEAFRADGQKVAALKLRHVLDLVRLEAGPGGAYAVYEDAPGVPAVTRAKAAVLDRMRAVRVAREVAATLAEVQKAGVLARELRPEAIIIPAEGEPTARIAAIGVGRLCEPPAKGIPDPAGDAFVPPERLKKADRADVRADLFGIGALLRLLLTGSGPTGKEPRELPDVPAVLKTILQKTLDPATGKRFLDFAKLCEEMEKAPGMKGTSVELRR